MALLYTFAFLFLLLKSTLQQVMIHRQEKNLKIGSFLHLRGHKLDVVRLATLELQDYMKCLTFCVKTDDCYSVNIKKQANDMVLCELLQRTKYQFPKNLTRDDGSSHWYAMGMSACVPDPCKPSGSCVTSDSDSEPFTCVCSSNIVFSGKYCEIRNYEKKYNFALLKPTAQSSTWKDGDRDLLSKYAVDGIKTTSCIVTGVPSCAHLLVGHDQWWRVDLQMEIPVTRVGIFNRNDFPTSLIDIEIKIGNSLVNEGRENPKCGDRHMVPRGQSEVFSCSPPLIGRYVVLQSFYGLPMVIIEVEVFAD